MLTRVLFGVVGFVFVLLALFVFPPLVLQLALALLCALATYELLCPTGLVKSHKMVLLCTLVSLGYSLSETDLLLQNPMHGVIVLVIELVLLLGLFACLLRRHDTVRTTEVLCGFFGALVLPHLLLSLLRVFQMKDGSFLVLLPLLAAWGSDTFAYFAGRLFGRHKLAPVVSPKKTVEGAVGGLIGGALCVLVFTLLLDRMLGFTLPYPAAALLGAAGAVIGQVGDLSFSVIKRQTGIKDYGHIFPGHGGVLDRFDSVIFVAPVVEAVLLAFAG